MKIDEILIRLTQDKARGGGVSVSWPRREAERLFIGKPAGEALALTPRLFSLCAHAQTLAARLALACAAGKAAQASSQELQSLAQEAARETLRKLLTDWALAFDGKAAEPAALAAWRAAGSLSALKALAEQHVFGQACDDWLQRSEAGWLDWAAEGRMPAARWLAALTGPERGCALLPPLSAGQLANRLADWIRPGGPVWQGQPRETGALAREHRQLSRTLAAGQLARARLLARLIQLARGLNGELCLQAAAAPLPDGALALVDTARGPLTHLAALDNEGCVTRYRVIPPTAWHSHPEGLLRETLCSRLDDGEAEWRRQAALIDPCVAWRLAVENKECAHA